MVYVRASARDYSPSFAAHYCIGRKIVLQRSEAGGEGLRIAIVDESVARAAVIEEGLREAGLTDVALLTERKGLVAHLTALEPDVVLISLDHSSLDTLDECFLVSRTLGKPIAMFVDQSDEVSNIQAID